ncbi:hypothetical protein EDC04DRAFT_2605588 [Pisolithus marmoratus]|nr:hypothetical protein EDC04DRAFT_2605588 [Pisolithus marmoratus]
MESNNDLEGHLMVMMEVQEREFISAHVQPSDFSEIPCAITEVVQHWEVRTNVWNMVNLQGTEMSENLSWSMSADNRGEGQDKEKVSKWNGMEWSTSGVLTNSQSDQMQMRQKHARQVLEQNRLEWRHRHDKLCGLLVHTHPPGAPAPWSLGALETIRGLTDKLET